MCIQNLARGLQNHRASLLNIPQSKERGRPGYMYKTHRRGNSQPYVSRRLARLHMGDNTVPFRPQDITALSPRPKTRLSAPSRQAFGVAVPSFHVERGEVIGPTRWTSILFIEREVIWLVAGGQRGPDRGAGICLEGARGDFRLVTSAAIVKAMMGRRGWSRCLRPSRPGSEADRCSTSTCRSALIGRSQ